MKKAVLLLSLLLFYFSPNAQTKGHINKETREFYLQANIKKDHQLIGYAGPSITTQKLIIFSVFTTDVKDNPNKCPLGAYYQTSELKEGTKIEYVGNFGKFVKMKFTPVEGSDTYFYFEKSKLKIE